MTGNTDCANLAYLLPVPQITSNGEVEVTTLLSCKGWKDWFVYDDAAWEDCSNSDETIQVTVSNNSAAFRPMATWTVLVSLAFHWCSLQLTMRNTLRVNLRMTPKINPRTNPKINPRMNRRINKTKD
jgi:hypothetical protein